MRKPLSSGVLRVALASVVIVLVIVGLSGPSSAQGFPTGPITLIVPWPAGGGSDIAMRMVAEAATKTFGVPVVVVNKPGAGGSLGTRDIATSAPDGYTIGMEGMGILARQYSVPNATLIKDVQPIVFFGSDPGALTVRTDTGWKTVEDFVKAAKANPGKIKNGNDDPGGSSYITIAVFEKALGIKVNRVPYKGYAPTVAALLAGEIQTATVPVPDVFEHHKAGKVRIIGVSDTQRHFAAPDVPTFKQQGFDVIYGSWRTILGPKGIPADRLKILEAKLLEAMNDTTFQDRARNAGFAVGPMGTQETMARWAKDDAMIYPILEEAGLVKFNKK
jgi:tripartite-type tricarboxylate transporter receptor subunit TctC